MQSFNGDIGDNASDFDTPPHGTNVKVPTRTQRVQTRSQTKMSRSGKYDCVFIYVSYFSFCHTKF